MKSACYGVLLLAIFSVVACKEQGVFSPNRVPVKPAEVPPDVSKGNQQFTWDLYGKLREKEGNLFFSPFSISTALAMTSTGAKGDTLKEMLSTLHLPEGDATHAGMGSLLAHLQGSNLKKNGYEVSVANALWGQKGYPWLKEFRDSTQKNYGAGLSDVDFVSDPEGARKTINTWVEKQTRDKIRDVIQPGVLTPITKLVLTNAIYFKGNWAQSFTEDQTQARDFTLQDGTKVKVPLMRQTSDFSFFQNDSLKVLELPYSGDQLSMVLFLPVKTDGLPDLEKQFTSENVDKWLDGLHMTHDLQVAIPKFKMESQFELNQTLGSLGMRLPFDVVKADFTGMTSTPELYITDVIHKAFVEVNEQGTEAAATTVVAVGMKGPARTPPSFTADHPFVFAIRDLKTKTILFVGRVANPK